MDIIKNHAVMTDPQQCQINISWKCSKFSFSYVASLCFLLSWKSGLNQALHWNDEQYMKETLLKNARLSRQSLMNNEL